MMPIGSCHPLMLTAALADEDEVHRSTYVGNLRAPQNNLKNGSESLRSPTTQSPHYSFLSCCIQLSSHSHPCQVYSYVLACILTLPHVAESCIHTFTTNIYTRLIGAFFFLPCCNYLSHSQSCQVYLYVLVYSLNLPNALPSHIHTFTVYIYLIGAFCFPSVLQLSPSHSQPHHMFTYFPAYILSLLHAQPSFSRTTFKNHTLFLK